MLFVRGIMGNIKLNPAIKLWGSVAIVVGLLIGSVVDRALEFREAVRECQAQGGTWVGGALPSAYCADAVRQDDNW